MDDYMLACSIVLQRRPIPKPVGSWYENKRSMASVLCTRRVAVRLKGGCVWLSFR